MRDDRGWSILPLMLTGTWSKPAVTLDTSAVKKQAIHSLTDKLFRKNEETRSNSTGKASEGNAEKPASKPEEQLLEHAIKGLFGN